jgi:RNA 2',3'-cyclic 3'-phosphodiesterase
VSGKIRTFIAIDTPPEFKIQAEALYQQLGSFNTAVRWEIPYKLHMTLKFLGATDNATRDSLELALARIAASHRPFWLKYANFGCFPNTHNPRIIWIGCTPLSSDLEHLQNDIESACADLGFDRENRAFHPHITIGRVKRIGSIERRSMADLIKKLESITFDAIETEVHTLLLVKSELQPGGSTYSILRHFSLSS